jgi:hypothetical protein
VATALLLSNFDFGFRATADQMDYTYWALTQSPLDWLRRGVEAGRDQGRIGHNLIIPLQILGGAIGDMWFYPSLCIGILPVIVFGFAGWLQMHTRSPVVVSVVVIYMALLPAGLNHWMPNAYPLLFLPLAVGLLCRLAFQRFFNSPSLLFPLKLILAAGIFIAAISFEIPLTLICIMAGVDAIIYLRQARQDVNLSRGYVGWQIAIAALATAAYLGYRLHHPSHHEANQLPVDPFLQGMVSTTLHLYNAVSFDVIFHADWSHLVNARRLAEAILIACCSAIAVYLSAASRPAHWKILAGCSVLIALATTIPIAANHKYVDWCINGSTCTYLDARFSLLGFASALSLLCAAGAALRWFRCGFAILVGCAGAITFLANADASEHLQWISSGERAAKSHVCAGNAAPTSDSDIVRKLVALPIVFHPWRDAAYKASYWASYVDHLRNSRFWNCPGL